MPQKRKTKSKRKTRQRKARTPPKKRAKRFIGRPKSPSKRAPRRSKTPSIRGKAAARRKTSARVKTQDRRKTGTAKQRARPTPKKTAPDPRLELALKDMNRGRSLTATARSLGLARTSLKKSLSQRHLVRRKGARWVTKDNRLRRVLVITGGRIRVAIVRGFEQASTAGAHYNAVGDFVRTNNLGLLEPYERKSVRAATGRDYPLETDPNALHRIAAMDTPPFHEIYQITSTT
jgi:hypothetical protein